RRQRQMCIRDSSRSNTYGGGIQLPRGLLEAVALFEEEDDLRSVLGDEFVGTYAAVKRGEFETFMQVISPWEREFLLTNV
ncbi:MAG: glutamine synthetase, partial [Anaerolineae bacterium]|nr:glutamine synthetase [Anaerolineae bacterium]